MENITECPVCHKSITDSGYEFGTEFKQLCLKCSCGAYVIINAETSEILKNKLEQLKSQSRPLGKQDSHTHFMEKKLKNNTISIGVLEESIKNAWLELKDESERAIWWDEQELVFPFYSHLKSSIGQLNAHLKQTRLYLIPQYAEKSSSCVEKIGEKNLPKYPLANRNHRKRTHSCKVDLAIIEFKLGDFNCKIRNSKATYWHIRHKPLVLLEFKVLTGKKFLNEMQKDLEKLAKLQNRYAGIKRVYFCFVTDKIPSSEILKTMIRQTHVQNLTLCYGTSSGEWNCTSPSP